MTAVNAVPSDSSSIAALLRQMSATNTPPSGGTSSVGDASFSDLLNAISSQSSSTQSDAATGTLSPSSIAQQLSQLETKLLSEFASTGTSDSTDSDGTDSDSSTSGAYDVAGSTGLASLLGAGGS
jgi:hypothetical protein